MANSVRVEILGQVLSVTSEDGEEHIQRVAGYVDERMRETLAGGRVVSSFTAAIMTALNIASEYHKLQRDLAQTEEVLSRLADRLTPPRKGKTNK
jgi:cell division protein ZapA